MADPEHVEPIPKFSLVSDPNPAGYWDDPQWSYKFYHPDQTSEVDSSSFFIKWDDTSPVSPNIGAIKILTSSNAHYYADLSSNTGQTTDGSHTMYLKATSARVQKTATLIVSINMKAKITPPTIADPNKYFVIGTSSEIAFALDYSVGLPANKTFTLTATKTDDNPLPNGVTMDTSVSQLDFSKDTYHIRG